MLAGPQRSTKRSKKPIATRSRAQTDFQRKQTSNTTQQQPKKAQDDLLDLFGSFATNNNNNNNEDIASANPFGDDFSDFVKFDNNDNTTANKENVSIEKPKKKKKKKKNSKKNGRKRAQT